MRTKAICPKCKSKDLILEEVWEGHTITWEQIDGEIERHDGSLEPGSPFRVESKCKACGHKWKLRGATQIDDIGLCV